MNTDFKKIEEKWQSKWEKNRIFEANPDKRKKFFVIEMFPYPSGSGLHMGHALNYTIGDIYARFKRMQGFNILYPMGYDSFGLPAENAAIKEKKHPKKFTEKAISNFIKQQKSLGLSYDWSRLIKTSDPSYYKWNQYFFLKFLENNLVYRKKSPVNFCKKCDTVLANEQVHNGKCWRHEDTEVEVKQLEQWFIRTTKYAEELLRDIEKLEWPEKIKIMQKNWIGKSEGVEILFKVENPEKNKTEEFPIFTTRPDTIFGVTFMVISSQHPKLFELVTEKQKLEVENFLKKIKSTSEKEVLEKEGAFTGSYAINPINNKKVPIYVGNFVLADYGSGMVMAVPAHDQRDFEFAKKYNLQIKPVIIKYSEKSYSFVMGIDEKKIKNIDVDIIEKTKEGFFKIKIPFEKLEQYKDFIRKNMEPNFWNEFSTKNGFYFIFKHKDHRIEEMELNEKTNDLIDKYGMSFNGEQPNKIPKNVYSWLAKNNFYKELLIHSNSGVLINSGEFNGLDTEEGKEHITIALNEKNLAKKTTQYKLKDWLISRQRYWGTPIPIVYCKNCGIVPVSENQLPVKLPEKVKFGKGNPLATNKNFTNVKCPKCKSNAKRETDTMDTFFDSSWYYLRYCDSKNSKKYFDKNKIKYWMPVDQYIGGAEHACMHLIYARFFTKALRDLNMLRLDEPFIKLFNQGMLHGKDGHVMSKSRGNVVIPEEISKKYGIDTARLFLVSLASPDKDVQWDEKGIDGSYRLIKRIFEYFSKLNSSKPKKINSSKRLESKLNKTIKLITKDIENFKYNLAVIKLRELFEIFSEEYCSKKDSEGFLKILSVFCPHIAEELWVKLGNKPFISLQKWPTFDENKIDDNLEKQDYIIKATISDINNIINLIKEKQGKKINSIYLYVIPKELNTFDRKKLSDKLKIPVKIFSVNNPKKYDPKNKSSNAKPGKPGIYIE